MLVGATVATEVEAQVASVASHEVTIRRLSETRTWAPARINGVPPHAIGRLEILQIRSNERRLKVVFALVRPLDGGSGLASSWAGDRPEKTRQIYTVESWIEPRRPRRLTLAELAPEAPGVMSGPDARNQQVVLTITR